MARTTGARRAEDREASKKRAERKKRIKEAREKRESGELRAKPNIKPIVKKSPEDERAERRAESEALKSLRIDLERVREDRTYKITDITLDYLFKKGTIRQPQHSYYKTVPENPEDRKTVTAKGVIEIVNEKLLFYFL